MDNYEFSVYFPPITFLFALFQYMMNTFWFIQIVELLVGPQVS